MRRRRSRFRIVSRRACRRWGRIRGVRVRASGVGAREGTASAAAGRLGTRTMVGTGQGHGAGGGLEGEGLWKGGAPHRSSPTGTYPED